MPKKRKAADPPLSPESQIGKRSKVAEVAPVKSPPAMGGTLAKATGRAKSGKTGGKTDRSRHAGYELVLTFN